MGQAKKRGTFEARRTEAIAKEPPPAPKPERAGARMSMRELAFLSMAALSLEEAKNTFTLHNPFPESRRRRWR